MKKQFYQARGGETYSAPTIDVLTVQVEQGFAASPLDVYGDNGFAGKDPSSDNSYDYGDL